MDHNLQDLRKSYDKNALIEDSLPADPWRLFEQWFQQAQDDNHIEEVNAMSLSTLGTDGYPKNRIVLLKEITDDKFVFYTNYTSEKAAAIDQHHKAGLHFFWPSQERQVIIKCKVTKQSRSQSEQYFNTRPRGSQIGAWASNQSSTVENRERLEKNLELFKEKFRNEEVPMPDFWGGYECTPQSFEFWQGRPNRLHDRILFEPDGDLWNHKRLAP
jgi:pyridoxamine 5'-phosphate oxidase